MAALINLLIVVALLVVTFFIGTHVEKKHYKSIKERERDSTDIVVLANRHAPEGATGAGEVVVGSVVVASDYFKRFVAGLIGFFGGRINVYESLLDRGRREAVLRMKDEARAYGADVIVNVKFETATLNDIRRPSSAMIEVVAYGTALRLPQG